MTRRIAVIGAGITGLAAALKLRALQPELDLVVYERGERTGGKIFTDRAGDFLVEAGPDAFLSSKRGAISLSHSLGLDDRMVSPRPEFRGSFVLNKGRLQPIPQGLSGLVPGELGPMVRSRLISPAGKARMALDFALPARRGVDDESLASFVSRRLGQETYERMIEPLLSGIYAGDGDRLSLAATFPQLRASEVTHGGILRGALAQKREAARRIDTPRPGFISFDGGMSVLTDRAAEAVKASGTRIVLGTSCTGIARAGGRGFELSLETAGGTASESFDGVVVAVPAWAAAPLLAGVSPDASNALAAIEHVSSALVAIGFPESQLTRPLNGYGYVVPRVEHRAVMAMTWISSKWQDRAPEGQALVRAFIGRAGQQDALAGDDASLVAIALCEMQEIMGLTVTPTLTRVYRWDRGMPQYNMGHLERVRRIESSLDRTPGIRVAGSMFRGVGIPDSIVSGETAAANILADLNEVGPPSSAVARAPGNPGNPGHS